VEKTLKASEAKRYLGRTLDGIKQHNDEVVIERYGKPVAVMVPAHVYAQILKSGLVEAQAAEQESRFKAMQEFKKNFNDVKTLDDIPDEVFAMRNQRGLTLSEAYKLYLYDHQNTEKAKIEAEQAAIKKIQQNSKSTAGNLGSAKVDTDIDFMSMKDADFEKMIQAVKMGKKIF
jgi:PHD/YefM family antitoxin component YafN of YafNO toxin-antitoxin module